MMQQMEDGKISAERRKVWLKFIGQKLGELGGAMPDEPEKGRGRKCKRH